MARSTVEATPGNPHTGGSRWLARAAVQGSRRARAGYTGVGRLGGSCGWTLRDRPAAVGGVRSPSRGVAELAGCRLGDTVSPALVAAVLLHPQGSTRGAPAGSRVVLLLNQADDEDRVQAGCEVARELIERGAEHIVIAALREPVQIRKVIAKDRTENMCDQSSVGRLGEQPVSAIVLAAGEGRRMAPRKLKAISLEGPVPSWPCGLGGKAFCAAWLRLRWHRR